MSAGSITARVNAGAIGLPAGTKEAGQRVDFRASQFDLAIETKGYRLAWSRASQCPCVSVHDQTDHPNPNCDICEGSGALYFRPDLATNPDEVGDLTNVQEAIIAKNNATVIRGIVSGLTRELGQWDVAGRIYRGVAEVTVNRANVLGYYDKLVMIDSRAPYSQLVTGTAIGTNLKTRYPIVQMNLLRSETTTYEETVDYEIRDGEVCWLANQPAEGTKLVAHYIMHPTYLVTEHPHSVRQTLVKQKTPSPKTPRGDVIDLPIQAMIRLEYIPE